MAVGAQIMANTADAEPAAAAKSRAVRDLGTRIFRWAALLVFFAEIISLDMHAKGVNQIMIDMAADTSGANVKFYNDNKEWFASLKARHILIRFRSLCFTKRYE